MCKTRGKTKKAKKTGNVHAVECESKSESEPLSEKIDPLIGLTVCKAKLKVLIDSGVSSDLLSADTLEDLKQQGIKCTSKATSDKTVAVISGQATLLCI